MWIVGRDRKRGTRSPARLNNANKRKRGAGGLRVANEMHIDFRIRINGRSERERQQAERKQEERRHPWFRWVLSKWVEQPIQRLVTIRSI